MISRYPEQHRADRIGWLRAAVLGANDGIVSTASLLVGVAAAQAARQEILVAGVAGLVAGAMSMAAGEYVSVSSQSDTERADLEREKKELATEGEREREELADIYIQQGLDPELAKQVAQQLMAHDALAAHARSELGISDLTTARPVQAALASAGTFAVGAALPLLTVLFTPRAALVPVVVAVSIVCLALLGGMGAWAGGAPILRAALRVTLWGVLAMGSRPPWGRSSERASNPNGHSLPRHPRAFMQPLIILVPTRRFTALVRTFVLLFPQLKHSTQNGQSSGLRGGVEVAPQAEKPGT